MSKNQIMHEQKFKDSTCLSSLERSMLDLESDVVRDLGSIRTGGYILLPDFFCFHAAKTKVPLLACSHSL